MADDVPMPREDPRAVNALSVVTQRKSEEWAESVVQPYEITDDGGLAWKEVVTCDQAGGRTQEIMVAALQARPRPGIDPVVGLTLIAWMGCEITVFEEIKGGQDGHGGRS